MKPIIYDPEHDDNGKRFAFVCFLLLLAVLIFGGCKTVKPVVVPQTHNEHHTTDSTTHDRQRDSIIVRDSVFTREKGDTVYKYVEHTVWQWRDREVLIAVHDTLHTADTIPQLVEVEKPVRIRNGYDRFTSWGFWIFVVLLLLRVAWWVAKKYLKAQTGGLL
jgi:hypothetical protein